MNYRKTMSRLNAALNKIDLAYETIAKKHGLTFNSLMVIYLIDSAENITQKQICEELHLPKSTVHSILLDFIKQDYTKLVEGSNKKEKFIVVTATGNLHFREILEETHAVEKTVLDALGDKACAFLTETAETVGNLLTEEIVKINNDGVIL
jgi:Transcriptional regulators